jgi:superfamily II DNA or RNA helicase
MNNLFAVARGLSDESTWNRAVKLARHADIHPVASSEPGVDEYRIEASGEPKAFLVAITPEDEDWDCTCPGAEDPCEHVLATLIALKQGALSQDNVRERTSGRGVVVHSFSRDERHLSFVRYVEYGDERVEVSCSLFQFVNDQSRVHRGQISVSDSELNIDHVLLQRRFGVLEPKTMRYLLPALARVSRVELDGLPIRVSPEVLPVEAEVVDVEGGYRVRRKMPGEGFEFFENSAVLFDGVLSAVEDSALLYDDVALLRDDGRFYPSDKEYELATSILPRLRSRIQVNVLSKCLPRARRLLPRIGYEIHSLENGYSISILPFVSYGDPCIARVRLGKLEIESKRDLPIRSPVEENSLLRAAEQRHGFSPKSPTIFSGQEAVSIVARLGKELAEWGDVSDFMPKGMLAPVASGDAKGISVEFSYAEGKSISAQTVIDAWRKNPSDSLFIEGGGWFRMPTEWLSSHETALERILAGRVLGKTSNALYLPDVIEIADSLGVEPPHYFATLRQALANHDFIPEHELPRELVCELRDYQKTGVNWLGFLMEHGIGALLADDMGLGKTVQALCALRGKTLIVSPTSVLSSWQQQIERFLPGRSIGTYHGSNRKLHSSDQITLTTYGILRSDVEDLSSIGWDTVVLDEAQVIRNPTSKTARAAYRLQAKGRICLTGTPIENSPRDLWSQSQFLNPGLLGSLSDFEREYINCEVSNKGEQLDRLRRRFAPFILRRFKSEVAKELPPKTEVVLECDLSEEERSIYEGILAATNDEVLRQIDADASIMSILEVLLRLRQACCHSALVPGVSAAASSKLDLLLRHLQQSKANGHRCLIFSQWVSLLNKLEPLLDAEQITFDRIDGSTKARGDVVTKFQSPQGADTLLISLKAGGVGLTLTAADHVYILDPWWNPAVEDQAADRAHRIGQINPVVVHRLVARDTVEQRVLQLQERKRQLVSATLGGGQDAEFALTREDLLYILDKTE